MCGAAADNSSCLIKKQHQAVAAKFIQSAQLAGSDCGTASNHLIVTTPDATKGKLYPDHQQLSGL